MSLSIAIGGLETGQHSNAPPTNQEWGFGVCGVFELPDAEQRFAGNLTS